MNSNKTLITLAIMSFVFLSACNTTQTVPTPDIRFISSKAIGYNGNETKILSGYLMEDPVSGEDVTVLLGKGQINSDGEFSFEFKKTIADDKLYSPSPDSKCNFTFLKPSVKITPSDSPLAVVSNNNKLLGALYLSTRKDLTAIGKHADYMYVNQDINIKGKCSYPQYTQYYNTKLKQGWNIVITEFKTSNSIYFYTSTDTTGMKWYFVPVD